jgi:glycosyltransferase involved in cell wall biosynthesis
LISGKYDETSRPQTLRIRSQLGLEKHWVIAEGLPNSVALYARLTLFVRPTITDGDSVSVRECLHLGVPVVASDAVPRPGGCLLFGSRDQQAMEHLVMSVLADPDSYRRRLVLEDSALPVIDLYRRVLDPTGARLLAPAAHNPPCMQGEQRWHS